MSSRRSRRVPPKGRGSFAANPPAATPGTDPVARPGMDAGAAETTTSADVRLGSRSANRAAKRATGVRPKAMARGGRPGGGPPRRSNTGIILLAVAAVAVVAAVIALGNPFGSPTASPTTPAASAPAGTATSVVGDGTCPTAQPAPLAAGETRTVTITTPKGDIVVEIDGSLSPIAAGNFVALVACHFYDGSVFHRTPTLQDGTPFVIQGGAPKPGTGNIAYTIQDEPVTTTYKRGTLAMARTSAPNSQTSQFFIVLDDKSAAPLASVNNYAIFGQVVSGMDVADAIYQASAGAELPTNPIPMTSVTVSAGPGPTGTPAPTAEASAAATAEPSTATPSTAP